MMGWPHDAVAISAAIPDELDREPVQTDVRPDLFVGTKRDERRDAVHPRQMTFAAAARDTMFCSAIPTLMKRSPNASAIPSTAMYPTSAVMNARSLRFPKSALIARTNSSRIVSPGPGRGMRDGEVAESLLV